MNDWSLQQALQHYQLYHICFTFYFRVNKMKPARGIGYDKKETNKNQTFDIDLVEKWLENYFLDPLHHIMIKHNSKSIFMKQTTMDC